MITGNTYGVTVRGVALENCALVINYSSGNSEELKFAMSAQGTLKLSTKPGGVAGTLVMTVSCQKSGTTSVRIPVISAVTVAPKAPAVPTPTATGSVQRYTKVCIEGNIPVNLFKVGCQDLYPFWAIDLCFNRLSGLAFSIYLDNYTGPQISSFTPGQRNKSAGSDSPGLCPDPSKPLSFTLGDFIPTQVVAPSNFRANYRLVYAYILNGKVQRVEYQFTIIPR